MNPERPPHAPLDTLQSSGQAAFGPLAAEVRRLGPWFHNLHLPDGTQTAPDHPLGDFPRFKWLQLAPHLPDDLRGARALDIGCNAGFYCFELARRGALVHGLDHDPHYLHQARWARDQLGLDGRVTFRQGSVYDLASSEDRYDLVLFMGVFYHLRYPVLGLDIVARCTADQLVFQSMTMPGDAIAPPGSLGIDERDRMSHPGWPKMAFIQQDLAGDPTNWWAPNPTCVEALLRSAGFGVVARPGHEVYLCRRYPALHNERADAELRAVIHGTSHRATAGAQETP